jgi:hypothetical protein
MTTLRGLLRCVCVAATISTRSTPYTVYVLVNASNLDNASLLDLHLVS